MQTNAEDNNKANGMQEKWQSIFGISFWQTRYALYGKVTPRTVEEMYDKMT